MISPTAMPGCDLRWVIDTVGNCSHTDRHTACSVHYRSCAACNAQCYSQVTGRLPQGCICPGISQA
ncbi:hypothetical protein XELAEV_18039972mg [Xenopus laevis]|uniref:Uncharacterized protein n=1 Tax=Xenopus laevis TaxID=8355 RepID=A0A974C8S0_XENLA|nr:hypothetical protein XELAEV_18039972mg [Xenopus laevis]